MDTDRARSLLNAEIERLEQLAAAQREQVPGADDQSQVSDVSPGDQHLADAAADLTDRETEQSLLDQAERRLESVRAALAKVDRGDYGLCEVCGEPIPDERLEHRPATRFCAVHRAEQERVHEATRPTI